MAWAPFWRFLLQKGLVEWILASCQFGSPHRKEFRILHNSLIPRAPRSPLSRRTRSRIPIQRKFTKPSAVYVPLLARHLAFEFKRALEKLTTDDLDSDSHLGFESPLVNDLLSTAAWIQSRVIKWRRTSHINALELSTAVSLLEDHSQSEPDSRVVTS